MWQEVLYKPDSPQTTLLNRPGQVISLAIASVLLSFSVPPVPSGSLFIMAPAFVGLGLPVEGVAILIALDVIPDLLKTTTIVTAHLASATVVARIAS